MKMRRYQRRNRGTIWPTAGVLALSVAMGVTGWPGVAAAQQDTRVQTGHALDANPQVGSGGVNTAVRQYQPLDSQLYVTGQVTGLAGFRGGVPYFASNQLHLNLPGQAVRDFSQRSVGVLQATRGTPYRTQAYLDPAQTALRLRGIVGGAARPGTNVPLHSTLTRDMADELFSHATTSYQRVIEPRHTSIISTAMRPVGAVSLEPGWMSREAPVGAADARMDRPGAVATFRLGDADARRRMIEELRALSDEDEEVEDARIDTRVDTAVDAEVGRAVELPPMLVTETVAPLPGMPKAGADVFHDVLVALREKRIVERTQEAEPGLDAEPDAESDDALDEETFLSESLVMIHRLGGEHRDYFNEFMRGGDRLLAQGRYYDAASQYEAAMNVNPRNPLAHVGAALAFFGAGELFSAGEHLRFAMDLFPPLMETRLDIGAMMHLPTFSERLKELKRELQENPIAAERPALLLLAAYLHNCTGEDIEARHYAHRLRAVGRRDELYQAYARFILTGRRPDERPPALPTRPAGTSEEGD